MQGLIVAVIIDIDELFQQLSAPDHVADAQVQRCLTIILGTAKTINTGDRCHNYHIAAAKERTRRRQPQPVDLFVDLGIFFNVGIRARNIRFRLIVIVVGDKIFDRVIGKELAELAVKLGGERLVMGHDQGRLLHGFDDFGHGKGVVDKESTRAGEEGLCARYRKVIDIGQGVVNFFNCCNCCPTQVT